MVLCSLMDWSPFWLSLKVSISATIISLLVGLPVAGWLSRRRKPGFADSLVNLPLVLPPTVLGYFLLVLLGKRGPIGQAYQATTHSSIVFTWQGAMVAACVVSIPLLIVQARVAFSSIDRELIDAARVFGATEVQIFRRIVLPMARRGVVAGTTLAFARALGDFGATLMVAGSIPDSTQTMPLAIYDALQTDDTHAVIVFVTISSLLAIGFTLLAARLTSEG